MLPVSRTPRQSRLPFATSAAVTIAGLARATGTSCRALRYYEEIGLLHPVRTRTGGRLFSAHQCDLASTIVFLRKLDISIAAIRSFLDTDRPEEERVQALRAALALKACALSNQLDDIRRALDEWCGASDQIAVQVRPVALVS